MTRQNRFSPLGAFLSSEVRSGLMLFAAAAAAVVVANLPWTAQVYEQGLHVVSGPVLAPALGPMTVELWINDGLMAIFFLVVGLEIKRELIDGELATAARRRLPFVAAACGMFVPALLYLLVVGDGAALQRGWAIPAATDIAFAMGVLALLGSRVPPAVKLLLTTIAIVDDVGAVAIIALAYTDAVSAWPLAFAGLLTLALYICNRRGVTSPWVYGAGFALLWLLVIRSGVHATIAGVIAAATIPCGPDKATSPLHRIERVLHPWSAYLIVPLFAFANAGVRLDGLQPSIIAEPLVLAVVAGLFLGKQAGIFGGIWAAVRFGIARAPHGATWPQLYGLALVAGIGFTMSLFIGGLAFAGQPERMVEVKVGVLLGSLLSAMAGATVLALSARRP